MKKITECKKKKLSIKFPSVTLTTRVAEGITLKKGDHIKVKVGQKIQLYGVVTVDQYESAKNVDRIEVDEVETVGKSKVKEVFVI